ncbi:MAG: 7TM-DISM domain-containing protein, partial [Marinicella sp.]
MIFFSACQLNYPSKFQGTLKIEHAFVNKSATITETTELLPEIQSIQFTEFNADTIIDFKKHNKDLLLKIKVTQLPSGINESTLTLFPKYLDQVSYFNQSKSKGFSEVSQQFRNRTNEHRYFSSQKFAFNIDHKDYDSTHYLLIKSNKNRFVEIGWSDTISYIKSDAQFSHFFTLVYSIILAMILFNAVYYLYNRDRSYLLYTLYMLTALYSLLWQEGKINDLPWLSWRVLGDYSGLIYVALSDLVGILFFYRFMRLNIYQNWLIKLVAICVVFRIGIMLTALIQFHVLEGLQYAELSALFNISIIVSSLLIWIIILIKTLQRVPQAKYLFVAWSLMIFSVMCRVYFSMNPHPDYIWMPHSYELAVMLEGLVLAFAMANRTMQFRAQRDHAVSKYNAAERSIYEHQLITQFQQEMQELVKDPTLSIEEVKEKTNIKFHLLINKAFPIKNSL